MDNINFFVLILNSILLGVGLAMDAFSVSIANTLNEPEMKKGKMCGMAGTYGFFQFAMPMIGWICVHTIAEKFEAFQKFIPWIALMLLLYIGGNMIFEVIKDKNKKKSDDADESENQKEKIEKGKKLTFAALLIQGLATSIDALSVGFTISEYNVWSALICCFIVGIVTFSISLAGGLVGRKVGEKLSGKADILGGIILIGIGIEIFVKGVFF